MSDNRRPQTTRGADTPGRNPPHDDVAERALLGGSLLSIDAAQHAATITRPDDFYRPAHVIIATAIAELFSSGSAIDPITVADHLRRSGTLDTAGGLSELISLQADAPGTTNAETYARIIHDHATVRRMIGAGSTIIETGYAGIEDAHSFVEKARSILDDVASQNGSRTYSAVDVADVAGIISGGLEIEEPDFLTRIDGKKLFYAGKIHVMQAEPSSGKTWIAGAAANEILELGGSVLYIDFEDSPVGLIGRMLALGAEPETLIERFRYVRIAGPFGPAEKAELGAVVAALNPDLVVIDGVAEAITLDGLSEDSSADVVLWLNKLPRWLARTGAAVVMLDHVVKDKESQGRWARGSGKKLEAVDGAAYLIRIVTPFDRHRAGLLKMVIAKDRAGGVGHMNSTAALVHIEPHADGARVVIRLEPDVENHTSGDTWKPTVFMTRISEELIRTADAMTPTMLKAVIHHDKSTSHHLEEAIVRLEQEGYIERANIGRKIAYRSVKPFDDPKAQARKITRRPDDEPPPDLDDEEPLFDVTAYEHPVDPTEPPDLADPYL